MEETSTEYVSFTVKIPRNIFEDLELRIPKGVRSDFVREAITEKMRKIPLSDRLEKMEKRLDKIEDEIGEIKKLLNELGILAYEKGKVNPYNCCQDEIDKKIVEFLIQHGGATTPEISKHVGENRWLILNRLKKIRYRSEKKTGRAAVYFLATERMGRKRAWWADENLLT